MVASPEPSGQVPGASRDGCASLHNSPYEAAYCPHFTDGDGEACRERAAYPATQLLGAEAGSASESRPWPHRSRCAPCRADMSRKQKLSQAHLGRKLPLPPLSPPPVTQAGASSFTKPTPFPCPSALKGPWMKKQTSPSLSPTPSPALAAPSSAPESAHPPCRRAPGLLSAGLPTR